MGAEARALSHRQDPSGKGVNVSRVVHRLGMPTRAYGLIGGRIGQLLQDLLDEEGVPSRFTQIAGETRINFTVRQISNKQQCRVLMPGPHVDSADVARCLEAIAADLPEMTMLVLSGGIPPGCPVGVYADIIRKAREANVRCLLDTHGEPLRLGLDAGPCLIKPNRDELAQLTGLPGGSIREVVAAARRVLPKTTEGVIVSLGPDGAVLTTDNGAWHLRPPEVSEWFAAGAGDSLLAAYAVARVRGEDPLQAACWGVAAGTAAVLAQSSRLAEREDIERLVPKVVPQLV